MKEFFISVLMAFLSFFGIHKEKQDISNLEITPTITETIIQEEIIVTPTEFNPSPTRKITPTSSPKPTALITEEVLKVFFNMSNSHEINQILSNKDKISEYEKYYYQKHKQFPIPRLAIIANKLYGLPSKNGLIICNSSQLKDLYNELSKYEEELAYKKMDSKCHYGNSQEKESQECQNWRKDHDQNRQNPSGSLDEQIKNATEDIKVKESCWDNLLEKYCK